MSLFEVPLGKPGSPIPQPAPPATPPGSAGPAPLAAAAAGTNSGSASGTGGGPTAGAASTGISPEAWTRTPESVAAAGTPINAPATRRAFGEQDATRQWRLADVFAAIGGGPRAERLIEAANRPGPVEPGSLTEALKALCPAPTLHTTRTV